MDEGFTPEIEIFRNIVMIKLKDFLTERVTSGDIIKIEKAIKKWHPQVKPLQGKIINVTGGKDRKNVEIEFSKWSDENRITVFMTRILNYKYITWNRNPNRVWFRK